MSTTVKVAVAFGLTLLAVVVWLLGKTPAEPSYILQAEVLALYDVEGSHGLRGIIVKFPDGSERTIETLVPFFYKPGYSANVAVYERILFADLYQIVADADFPVK